MVRLDTAVPRDNEYNPDPNAARIVRRSIIIDGGARCLRGNFAATRLNLAAWDGHDVKSNPVTGGDFFATIYHALGIDPKVEHLPAADSGRAIWLEGN